MDRKPRAGAVFAAALIAAGALGISAYRALTIAFPDVSPLKDRYPVMQYQGPGEPPSVALRLKRPEAWVPLDGISPPSVAAVLVSEDWSFYQHAGYDPRQILDAALESVRERRFVRGASTITQQVARNVFLSREKTLWRKLREIVLAMRIEEALSKRRILEIYMNIAEWGEGVYGIGAASRHYFDKAPSDLTAKEGAFLAMLLPNPRRYGESFRQERLTRYADRIVTSILVKMVQAGYLPQEDLAAAMDERLPFEEEALPPSREDAQEDAGAPLII